MLFLIVACSTKGQKADIFSDPLFGTEAESERSVVESRINGILQKYIYTGKVESEKLKRIYSVLMGKVERYETHLRYSPNSTIDFNKEIEPLYTSILAGVRYKIQEYPSSAIGYEYSSYLKLKVNDISGAIKDINKAISLDPKNSEYYSQLANCYEWAENYNLACENYKIARDMGARINQSDIEKICNKAFR